MRKFSEFSENFDEMSVSKKKNVFHTLEIFNKNIILFTYIYDK